MAVSEGGQHYQRLIDEIVGIAQSDVTANRIRKNGHGERTNDDALPLEEHELAAKELLLSLSGQEREIVARMVEDARQYACHDVLAFLEWRHSVGGMDIVVDGVKLPKEPFFGTMHHDFVARLDGDAWPEERLE